MDINPYEFKDPELYELGNFMKDEEINILLFISAWTESEYSPGP